MPHPADEARLDRSKMSFGEHLEELRKTLFKCIAALFVGFLVGLYFGNDIVYYIQTPLLESLERFYLNQAVAKQQKRIDELESGGKVSTERLLTTKELHEQRLMPMEFLVSVDDFREIARQHFPDLPQPAASSIERDATAETADAAKAADDAKSADAPRPSLRRDRMIRIRLYQPIEEDARLRVVGHTAMEPFSVYIRASLIAGLVMASPFIFYFIWEFVAAGLYRQEQSYVYTYLPVSLGLFVGGVTLAFFYAFEPLLDFMFWYYERMGIQPDLRLTEWISFVMLLPLGFGVSFQLPLVMLLLERIGVFTVETYWRKWRAAIIVIAFVAMLLTPSQDPYSMLLMGLPLVGLYFAGIWMCKHMPGAKRRTGDSGPLAAGS